MSVGVDPFAWVKSDLLVNGLGWGLNIRTVGWVDVREECWLRGRIDVSRMVLVGCVLFGIEHRIRPKQKDGRENENDLDANDVTVDPMAHWGKRESLRSVVARRSKRGC